MRIPLRPIPAPRPRGKQGQHAYYPKTYSDWLEAATLLIRSHHETHDGPVSVVISLDADGFGIKVVDVERTRPIAMPGDVDNFAKSICDAAQKAGLIRNDSQIQSLTVYF